MEPRSDTTHFVRLFTRAGCHACAEARDDVARICGELGVAWRTEDVDDDAELRAEYGDRVPVLVLDGAEHGYGEVEEQRFRAALECARTG
jgi:glutaredoxin